MTDKINMYNNNTSSSIKYYYYLKYNILYIITNTNYCNILYLMRDKGFTYHKEVKGLLGIDGDKYLDNLKNLGIAESYELSEKEKEMIKLIKPNSPVRNIKSYRLNKLAREIIENDFLYDIFVSLVHQEVINHKEDLLTRYKRELERKEKEEEIKEEKIRRQMEADGIKIIPKNNEVMENE